MIYVDTSVIVATLDPTDSRRPRARKALEVSDGKVVSELVIAELASVLTRQEEVLNSIKETLGMSKPIALLATILYILKRFNLNYVSIKGHLRNPIGSFYKPLAYAIELAEKIRLRTLDLLHLAYIKVMKEQGLQISTLLTADTDFKDRETNIHKVLDVYVNLIE